MKASNKQVAGIDQRESDFLLPFERQTLRGHYREYLAIKRNNFFATIQKFPGIWDCFERLDEIWMREFSDLERQRNPDQMLPLVLFLNAHAQFRTSFELGFSCSIVDALNILRSGIESVAHAGKILREPQLAEIWLEKDDGRTQLKAFKNAFERKKTENLFPPQHGMSDLHKYWSQFSEWATHTTVASLAQRFASKDTATDFNWRLEYLETDPEKLATFLFSLLDASCFMERALFRFFEERLKLDPELVRMRKELDRRKQALSLAIIKRFKLKPPLIWT